MAFQLIRYGGDRNTAEEQRLNQMREGVYQSLFKYDAFYLDILKPSSIYRKKLNLQMILRMHRRVYRVTRDAGVFRTINVRVGAHLPVDHRLVALKMGELVDWFNTVEDRLGVLELTAQAHYRLV
ncbi:hypothetical protein niasHS_013235 [Heterodera schachtii]|uniref:Fido domain-containing protein n=1 Tax=Heterodera schachtii TaxID=97005 RepID=A0ABD2IIC5_HETSC